MGEESTSYLYVTYTTMTNVNTCDWPFHQQHNQMAMTFGDAKGNHETYQNVPHFTKHHRTSVLVWKFLFIQ